MTLLEKYQILLEQYQKIEPKQLRKFMSGISQASKAELQELSAGMTGRDYTEGLAYICADPRYNPIIADFVRPRSRLGAKRCLMAALKSNLALLKDMPPEIAFIFDPLLQDAEFVSQISFTIPQLKALLPGKIAVEQNLLAKTYVESQQNIEHLFLTSIDDGIKLKVKSSVDLYLLTIKDKAFNTVNLVAFYNQLRPVIDKLHDIEALRDVMTAKHYKYSVEYFLSQSWFNMHLESFLKPDFDFNAKRLNSAGEDTKDTISSGIIRNILIFNNKLLLQMPDSIKKLVVPYLSKKSFIKNNSNLFMPSTIEYIIEANLVDKKAFLQDVLATGNRHVVPVVERELLSETLGVAKPNNIHKL